MLATQDDHTVIQQVLKGQTAAYSVLVERYQSFVFTLALRYVPNRETAEELAQDIFVKAFRCLADFKGNSKFSTWLYTIVNTTCISYLRKKQDIAILPASNLPGMPNNAH
jgi:RNA polymerase sigma factor (sigma-70 family)